MMIAWFTWLINRFNRHIVSRWVVLVVDMVMVAMSFVMAYLLRFNFVLGDIRVDAMWRQLLVYCATYLVSFAIFKPYSGIVRHSGLKDAYRVFYSVILSLVLLLIMNTLFRYYHTDSLFNFSIGVLFIAFLSSLFFLLILRLAVKLAYISFSRQNKAFEHFLIFGAGELGLNALYAIEGARNGRMKVTGFIDDNPSKVNKSISGITVYSDEVLNQDFLEHNNVVALILAVYNISPVRRASIIERCLDLNLEVRTVPDVEDWAMGSLSFRQIRKVHINELLARDTIALHNETVASEIEGKIVLVTGAAGSIGSELARQLNHFNPAQLVLLDNAETPLFHLEQAFLQKKQPGKAEKIYVLADISDLASIRRVFETYRPELVYHAAAYKHVPVMESNPLESIRVNVFGTQNIIDLADGYQVNKFVLISTDKAVNPTSVMGASKRIAELMVQSKNKNKDCNTQFITTRFGNVMGSNGSVLPIFEKQIASGGPVTITHPEMIRYFMTIPEACELVLEASVMGKGGEIFVFDMGEQQRIADVAEKMIKLSGLRPGIDIDIVYTGLRPGEKLYEELFNDCEDNIPTHHPKIMIARMEKYPFQLLPQRLERLKNMFDLREPTLVGVQLKRIVPEYSGKQ